VPARCPAGLETQGPRCCGIGQGVTTTSQCAGSATACASDMLRDDSGACVLPEGRIQITGGTSHFAGADWEGSPEAVHDVSVPDFEIDRAEVSVARFQLCTVAEACPKIADDSEPGRPVRNVSPAEAESFCAFAGGHLSSSEEWLFAAGGNLGRRYPWGSTGLVCRRASFGLVNGPCAHGASGPDLVGARPDGATPEGVLDLAGNVAEWTREPDGSFVARGGSYRSQLAGDLKTWAAEPRQTRAPHVGFRCAYPSVDASTAK
jgi:formylglycine-generating enzyme